MAGHLENPELEARIIADPDDVAAFLVYGDWLSERGDPRGELVAVQAKLSEVPNDATLRAKEAELLRANAQAWLGDFAGKGPKDLALTWRYGFLDSVRLGPPLDDYDNGELEFPAAISTLMALPGISFVREVTVGSFDFDDYPTSWSDVIQAMVEHGVPACLRSLAWDRGGFWDISSTELGDLSPLYPRLARLHSLRIEMGHMELGAMDLPALRSLEIVTGGLTAANVASIAKASWPNLERLSLCIGQGGNDFGCDVTFENLTPLLAAQNLGRVRHLGLANTDLADRIAEALAASKILPQLRSLDLSRGSFGPEGARAILDHAAAFAHLEAIDLTHSYLPPELGAELTKIGPRINLADPQRPEEDPGDRYVQISE